jgi:acyl carrier protein
VPSPAIDQERVKAIIADVYARSPHGREMAPGDIDLDFPLYSDAEGEESLGLDSLDAVEIATELEEEFDLVMPAEIDPSELRTVRLVVQVLERLAGEQHLE